MPEFETDPVIRLRGLSSSGADFPIEVTCSPLHADDELLLTSSIRDISERVKAEERILQLNLELEKRVKERTAELVESNDALRQSEERLQQALSTATRAEQEVRRLNEELEQRIRDRTVRLEAANKELEAFSYSVSHDLRTPLRGIDGWSLALVEDYRDQLDQRVHEYLDRVSSEAQRMSLLIDDMLQLPRVSRAEMQLNPVHLTTLAKNIAARLHEAHPHRTVEFRIEP